MQKHKHDVCVAPSWTRCELVGNQFDFLTVNLNEIFFGMGVIFINVRVGFFRLIDFAFLKF